MLLQSKRKKRDLPQYIYKIVLHYMKKCYIEYIKTSHNHDKSTSKSLFMVAFYL